MNRHPYLLALLLAMTTLTGFVGMMVIDGVWDIVFMIVAVLPLAIGIAAWWRARARAAGSP